MTIFAPYMYNWGMDNPVYKIRTCADIKNKLNGNAVTIAFVIGDSQNKMSTDIYNYLNDIKSFQANNGRVIISFGGAAGTYLEAIYNADQEFAAIDKLLQDTGCRAIDFDVEGGVIGNTSQNDQRAKVIARLQQKYTNLYVSFTLAVDAPHPEWSSAGGIPQMGIDLLKNAIQNNVNITVINAMTMDFYMALPSGKTWGGIACDVGEAMKLQIKKLYPTKTDTQLYNMIGLTAMIGRNDDNTVFTVEDAKTFANYAKTHNIGLISFWSIQRDQTGTGDLGVYSQVNKTDFEYYKSIQAIIGTGSVQPVPVPVQPDPVPVQPTPVPVQPTPVPVQPVPVPVQPVPQTNVKPWADNTKYVSGDLVSYTGKTYQCLFAHTSIVTWAPGIFTQSIWKETTTPVQPVPVQPQPIPVKPTPVPVQPTPVPVQPTPVPVQPTPVPAPNSTTPNFAISFDIDVDGVITNMIVNKV